MTPQQLTTWPTAQLQDALQRYGNDYTGSQRLRIEAELTARGEPLDAVGESLPTSAVAIRGASKPVLSRGNLKRAALRWLALALPLTGLGLLAGAGPRVILMLSWLAPLVPLALFEFGWETRRPKGDEVGAFGLAFLLGLATVLAATGQAVYLTERLGGAGVEASLVQVSATFLPPYPLLAQDCLTALGLALLTHLRLRRTIDTRWTPSLRLYGIGVGLIVLVQLGGPRSELVATAIVAAATLLCVSCGLALFAWVDRRLAGREARRAGALMAATDRPLPPLE